MEELSDLSGLSSSYVFNILNEKLPYFSAYNRHFFCPEICVEKWVHIMQRNTKLFIFFPQHCICCTDANSYDKSDWSSKTRTRFGKATEECTHNDREPMVSCYSRLLLPLETKRFQLSYLTCKCIHLP